MRLSLRLPSGIIFRKGITMKQRKPFLLSRVSRRFTALLCQISIRRRLILFFLLLSIIPVLLLGPIAYQAAGKTIHSKITQYALQSLIQASIPLDLLFQKYEDLSVQLLIDLEDQTRIKEYFRDAPGQPGEQPKIFEDSLVYDPNIRCLLLAALNKTDAYLGAGFGNLESYYSRFQESPVYQQAVATPGQLFWGIIDNDLLLARLINDLETGEPLAVFAVIFNGLKINEIINFGSLKLSDNVSFTNRPYAIMINAEGTILSSPFYDEMGLTAKDLIGGTEIGRVLDEKLNNGYFSTLLREEQTLVTYYKMPSKDWYLLGFAPYDYLYKELRELRLLLIGFILLLCVVAVSFSYTIALGIAKPLHQVKEAMAKAQNGDLTVKVQIDTRDELHDLGNSFNLMTAQIGELLRETKEAVTTVSDHSKVLESSSIQSAKSAEAIAIASNEISKGMIQQTAEAEKTARQMSRLAGQIDVAAHKFKEVEEITVSTRDLSERSKKIMEDLKRKSTETDEITNTILANINELNKQSEAIKDATQLIANIAEQTTLLALNAAIEAARAKEVGAGFGVVAKEVNKLAQRTDTAAKAIESLLKEIESKAADSAENAAKAREIVIEQTDIVTQTQATFDEIIKAMDLIVARMKEVNHYVEQINAVKNETTESTQNIVAISQQSAASSEEVAASTEEQTAISEQVKKMANDLKAMAERLVEAMLRFNV